jgi:uncharacterized protein (DUF302 family)
VAEDEEEAMETVTYTDTHVTVPSNKTFKQVVQAVESVLGEGDIQRFAQMVELVSSWEEFEKRVEQAIGSSGLMVFAKVDHGAWRSLVPHDMKGKMYMIGNPLIARRMLEHVPEIGLYVPVRIYVYEDGQGTTRVDYDRVSSIFERFDNEQVNEVARMLDRKLEELATTAAR